MGNPFLPGMVGCGVEPWCGPAPAAGAPAPPSVAGYLPGLESPEIAAGMRRWRDRYDDRLRRADWLEEIRPRIIERARGRCERCKCRTDDWEVHHLNYDRLGCERDSDLQALCPACHPAADAERRAAAYADALERAEAALEEARFRGWCLHEYGECEPPAEAWERFEEFSERMDAREACE